VPAGNIAIEVLVRDPSTTTGSRDIGKINLRLPCATAYRRRGQWATPAMRLLVRERALRARV
jgi:hypothetical protein